MTFEELIKNHSADVIEKLITAVLSKAKPVRQYWNREKFIIAMVQELQEILNKHSRIPSMHS